MLFSSLPPPPFPSSFRHKGPPTPCFPRNALTINFTIVTIVTQSIHGFLHGKRTQTRAKMGHKRTQTLAD